MFLIILTVSPMTNDSSTIMHGRDMVPVVWSGLEEVFFGPRNQTVKEGEGASFRCVSGESSSPAAILWIKDGSVVTTGRQSQGEYGGGRQKKTSGTLHLVNVSVEDSGEYVCQTVNPSLNISRTSRPARLTVLAAPSVTVRPPALTVALGGRASLHCEASGEPPPSISWLKRGHSKQTGAKMTSGARNATLRIESARSYDEGTYVCDASNALGRSRATLTLVVAGSLPPSVSPQLRSTSVPPVQPLVTQVHSPMLPPPPYPNLPMELPQHPEPQTDARPTTRASTRPPHTTVTKSSLVRLENSLQRPSNQARTPTAEPAEVRGLVDSGGQNSSRQDQSVASSKEGDEEQRNTSQSPMTSKDPRSRVTPQSPLWLPVLEKHDVPIVVGVGVSLAFIFITVAFYSMVQRNEPAPTGRAAKRNLGVPMRHAERHHAGPPYENRAFEDDECLAVTEHNTNTSDTGARPPGLSLVTVQTEPTCEDPRSVTVETYPEPVVDTKIDYSEEEEMKDEEKGHGPPSTPNTPSLQLTEEEWPSITADNRSLCQDTGLSF
ncbi:myosin light chain kinase, smooth muscle [Hippocampus comes]|uniref:myosin light chain kinase, smooth muscle n=1 Tax=Hippocampus comes TaxID=109280 RepID=UPI00094EF300|nr:PREDICTED: myosin light chain kinase, smooth muscle-like [Hippocampus comes]